MLHIDSILGFYIQYIQSRNVIKLRMGISIDIVLLDVIERIELINIQIYP